MQGAEGALYTLGGGVGGDTYHPIHRGLCVYWPPPTSGWNVGGLMRERDRKRDTDILL